MKFQLVKQSEGNYSHVKPIIAKSHVIKGLAHYVKVLSLKTVDAEKALVKDFVMSTNIPLMTS